KSPAHATAKSVIASANRLIELRHPWRNSRRIAEISVPAWPMPIHHTKLMMSKAQPTGMLLPQIPMPVNSRCVTVTIITISSANEIPKPTNQPSGVFLLRTRLAILSVTDANVWPGPMTGSTTLSSLAMPLVLAGSTRHLRVRVADGREVRGARLRLQLAQQRVVAVARLELRHAASGVVLVAEGDGARRAGRPARGHDLPLGDLAALVLGVDADAVDPLHAVGALLHDTARAHRDLGIALQLEGRRIPVLVEQEVEATHLVGAVVRAVARSYAAVVDHVVQAFVAVDGG